MAQFDSDYSGGEGASIFSPCRCVNIFFFIPPKVEVGKQSDLGYY